MVNFGMMDTALELWLMIQLLIELERMLKLRKTERKKFYK